LAGATPLSPVLRGPESRLHNGAVHDGEAEEKDRQCRNWPNHAASIALNLQEQDPYNEVSTGLASATSSAVSSDGSRGNPRASPAANQTVKAIQ
jgi:hypothetical protein